MTNDAFYSRTPEDDDAADARELARHTFDLDDDRDASEAFDIDDDGVCS